MAFFGIFSKDKKEKLDEGLSKTKDSFLGKITRAVAGKSKVDESFLDDLEEILITSDVGADTTFKIIDRIEERVARDKYINTAELNKMLKEEISGLLRENKSPDGEGYFIPDDKKPFVIMVVGVNGVGKTTSIGKLAKQLKDQGKKVVLGAADTFRAAAIDQLEVWADRAGVDLVKKEMGSDPAAVAFETLQKGLSDGADVIIIDTAGRLHNKVNLMNELGKVKRVMSKVIPDAPHEVLLVLDASTGQNAIEQARHFTEATQVSGIVVTKLDGTAKGGVVLGIADQFQIPIKFIGIGEAIEDLQTFSSSDFVEALFK